MTASRRAMPAMGAVSTDGSARWCCAIATGAPCRAGEAQDLARAVLCHQRQPFPVPVGAAALTRTASPRQPAGRSHPDTRARQFDIDNYASEIATTFDLATRVEGVP